MHDPVRIPVFFDFASSVCYFTHRVMMRIGTAIEEAGIELVWSPIDLTILTGWQRGAPFDDVRRTNIRRLSEELSIPVAAPTHWMDSREALAAHLALPEGDANRWREAVWCEVYEHGRSLDDPGFLDAAAAAAGLPPPSPQPADRDALERRSLDAMRMGVVGVPTFVLDAYPLGIGIQDDATMLAFLTRFAARRPRPS